MLIQEYIINIASTTAAIVAAYYAYRSYYNDFRYFIDDKNNKMVIYWNKYISKIENVIIIIEGKIYDWGGYKTDNGFELTIYKDHPMEKIECVYLYVYGEKILVKHRNLLRNAPCIIRRRRIKR